MSWRVEGSGQIVEQRLRGWRGESRKRSGMLPVFQLEVTEWWCSVTQGEQDAGDGRCWTQFRARQWFKLTPCECLLCSHAPYVELGVLCR